MRSAGSLRRRGAGWPAGAGDLGGTSKPDAINSDPARQPISCPGRIKAFSDTYSFKNLAPTCPFSGNREKKWEPGRSRRREGGPKTAVPRGCLWVEGAEHGAHAVPAGRLCSPGPRACPQRLGSRVLFTSRIHRLHCSALGGRPAPRVPVCGLPQLRVLAAECLERSGPGRTGA